mmetsp:Transcript_5270/g.8097  ORF Transcript_5270/g.8097 Transcript_5270/m.8097 type:complete len:160 (+) Transcript_5270:134-613(+)|eukprot:CAMPEP_0203759084 /NCGR_PEP_ID=MMETSP0098-20131031/11999_1 /ASSEMBLY_ACC=CAM_ASM_000208 /TAXON_ID=96639 /ORGANISM=" , Strain NY0313808BC1" /LENGTH=159 /DNA_ID=CAMNT_0050651825 /DNA_START=165 /DNA_END=644 /DNA_ORIENTATION=-
MTSSIFRLALLGQVAFAKLGQGGECEELREQLKQWKILAYVMLTVIIIAAGGIVFGLLRRRIIQLNKDTSPERKLWYTSMEDEDVDFSDSMSESSSLFSPPFRPNDGVNYKPAAAKVCNTQAYLVPSSNSQFNNNDARGHDESHAADAKVGESAAVGGL